MILTGMVSYRGGGGGGGGEALGYPPPKRFLPAPRIFTIKIYINEISYVIHYNNGRRKRVVQRKERRSNRKFKDDQQ